MDPASAIIGIASGAAALVAITSQVVSYIINLRDDNCNLSVILYDLVLACQAYETAWVLIRTWLVESRDPSTDGGEPIIQELNNFLEGGKVMMELIHADLDRLTKAKDSNWWQSLKGKNNAQLLLHKHTVREHRDRIHCQNTSLHLLLSCAKLPSKPLQEAAVEISRPKFRKDAETAWTIVNSRLSVNGSKAWPTTPASSIRSGVDPIVSVNSDRILAEKTLSFDDDLFTGLFTGPVYKRMLIRSLCESPSQRPHLTSSLQPSVDIFAEGYTQSQDERLNNDEPLPLELGQQSAFSRSCHQDYLEFTRRDRPRKLRTRHLPLASIWCRHNLLAKDRKELDDRFLKAVRQDRLEDVAAALDDGADINARLGKKTAIEACVKFSSISSDLLISYDLPGALDVAEFLMLYKETHVPCSFDQDVSILHICMYIGATADFMVPFFQAENEIRALGQLDSEGKSVLHAAVSSGTAGCFALLELKKVLKDKPVPITSIIDNRGISAYKFAKRRGKRCKDHLSALQSLAGGSPNGYTRPGAENLRPDTSVIDREKEDTPGLPLGEPCKTSSPTGFTSRDSDEQTPVSSTLDPAARYSGLGAEPQRRSFVFLPEETNDMNPM